MDHSETVYVLLEKDLRSEYISVVGVYASYDLAEEFMEELMDLHEDECSYKIESKSLVGA